MIPEAAVRGNGQAKPVRAATLEQAEFQLHEMAMNAMTQRQMYFQQMMDPRRDLDKECGYPSTYAVGADLYRTLYDREPIATRVVQLMPKECWQVMPRVYEDESSKNVTEFEQAWDDLGKQITAEKSWYQDEEGSTVWAELAHADILSGLGSFGIILLGLDDGKDYREPVEGAISDKYVRDRKGKVKTTTNGAARVDLSKLSIPTPMPPADRLDSLVANSQTLPPDRWKDGSGRTDKHVPFDPALAVSPEFVRNEQGQAVIRLRNAKGEVITDNEFRSVGDMVQGTDSQYMGVQLGISQYPVDKPVSQELQLTFLRTFSEDLVQIVQYEANVRNPRFGMPVTYRITFNDPRETHSGIGLPIASIYVNWTRVIHLLENPVPGSKTFGVPRMRPVLNPLLDIRKIRGSGAEGYWQSCFPGIALSTHPQLGGEVAIDETKVKGYIENYMNSLQRWLVLAGMGATTIAPTVTDPTPHINVQIEAICIQLGCPVRVFKGSERGELASSQDDSSWNDRLRHRQNTYITPGVICKFIDRLIILGVLPEPEGYSVEWPDLDSVSLKDKAGIFAQRMTAFSTYVSGQVETMLPVRDMLTREAGYDEEEADAIIEANEKAQEEAMTQTMPPAGEDGHPATVKEPPPPSPLILGPGQTAAPNPNDLDAKGKPFTAPGKPLAPVAAPSQEKVAPAIQGRSVKNEAGEDVVWNAEEGRWVTLPSGAHIQVKDGEIVKGPKIDKKGDDKGSGGKKQKGDEKARDKAMRDIKRIMKEKGIKHEEDHGNVPVATAIEDIPTATLIEDDGRGAGGYEKGSAQERAYIAGERVRGAIKSGGKAAAKLAMGLGKKAAKSELGQRVGEEFREAGGVVREAAGKVKGFFKNLRKKLSLNKREFLEFQRAIVEGYDHEVYPESRTLALNFAQEDPTVAAWWYALQSDDVTGNSNPEGCNQYKPCSTGGDETREVESSDPYTQPPKPSTPEKIASEPADPKEHLMDALKRCQDRTQYPRDETDRVMEKLSGLNVKQLKELVQDGVKVNELTDTYIKRQSKPGILAGLEEFLDKSWQMWEKVSA